MPPPTFSCWSAQDDATETAVDFGWGKANVSNVMAIWVGTTTIITRAMSDNRDALSEFLRARDVRHLGFAEDLTPSAPDAWR